MTVDRIRCVRDHRYKYIRNFLPDRPYTQHNSYIETQYPTQQVMKDLFAQGKLNAVQSLFMQPHKPEVEFYDIVADPHEVRNLASDPKYRKKMEGYEKQLQRWIEETHDKGAVLESAEVVAAES